MGHIVLHQVVSVMPHAARMRERRDRKLRAIRPSRKNELWYRAQLGSIVKQLRLAGAEVAADMRFAWVHPTLGDSDRPRAADVAEIPGLGMSMARAARKFGNIGGVAERLAAIAVRQGLQAVDERLIAAIRSSLGINVGAVMTAEGSGLARAMKDATAANIDLIKSIPEEYLADVRRSVVAAWETGQRWEDLAAAIAKAGDAADNRAKVIARDQTSKINAALNQVRQTDLGIEEYDWSGVMDQRERDSHRRMEGVRCRWDKPPSVDGENVHPGQAIMCRCTAIPVIHLDAIAAPDLEEAA